MDLKTFAEEDFDPKKWINKAWSSSGNQGKEVFVANTVTRLQLYMKQLTNSLDETTTQIVTSIPRVLQDTSALQLEGMLLLQQLLSLERKVHEVEEQTGNSIESLQRIDQLKSRLENAASALREADKWAALATTLEEILEAGVPTQKDKLGELADQVAAMTASLEVLSDSPDYESKRLQMETLYNRLEAAITPPLIEALTQMDAERTTTYVTLFTNMSRHVSACRCWRRASGARLAAQWRRLDVPSLPALTALLSAQAATQVEWLITVLKTETPLAELIRLYTDLLLSLEPPPTKVVSANLKLCSTPEEGINLLTDLRSDIDEFVTCIRNAMDAPRQNKEVLLPATVREFGRAAYAPLRELLPKYTELQTQLLLAHLNDPHLKQDDLLELSRALLSTAERCEGWVAGAYSKAKKIAGVAAYPFYIPAVDNFITAISNLISSHSRHIETAFLSSVSSGHSSGVLSATFPASLVLETAASTLLEMIAKRQEVEGKDEGSAIAAFQMFFKDGAWFTKELAQLKAEVRTRKRRIRNAASCRKEMVVALYLEHKTKYESAVREAHAESWKKFCVPKDQHPLSDLATFLLEAEVRARIANKEGAAWGSVNGLRRSASQLRALARAVLRSPATTQLEKIPQLGVWNNNDALSTDLPDFALSPQEYITEIGQYLMTLPQHLEMHLSDKQAPWQFLSEVCTHTCDLYAEKILNIRNMDALGTKRCLTDIAYLSSVVEDLGSSITPALHNLEKSLRAAAPQNNE